MKKFFNQFLLLGGFYFLISFVLNCLDNIPLFIDLLTSTCFIFILVTLIVKKSFHSFNQFQQKHPKLTEYLKAVGLLQYFGILFVEIPNIVEGYKTAAAQYNNNEHNSFLLTYMEYMSIIYTIGLIISLSIPTFQIFILPCYKKIKLKNSNNIFPKQTRRMR